MHVCAWQVKSLKSQLADKQAHHEGEVQDLVKLLDIKAGRLQQTEAKMKEVAYRTQISRLDFSKFDFVCVEERMEEGERVELERGQNLMQFNISQVYTGLMCHTLFLFPPPSIYWHVIYALDSINYDLAYLCLVCN